MIPDWQLPPGVDRGLHDYLHSAEMVAEYDAMMAASPLAALDVRFCQRWFAPPGRVIDLGCGTGRLAKPLTELGHEYVGVDLSEEMLRSCLVPPSPGGVPLVPPSPGGRAEGDSSHLPSLRGGRRAAAGGESSTSDSESPLPVAAQPTSPQRGEVFQTTSVSGTTASVRSPDSPSPLTPLPPGEGGTSKDTIPLPPGAGGTSEDTDPPGEGGTSEDTDPPGAGGNQTFHLGNLVELASLPAGPFDYGACLFSTLGMIVGAENRRTAVANAAKLLKPGGVFVLHVHNRYFRELGFKGIRSGDITMPQAYGGAPLTLHHFSRREAVGLLKWAGFQVLEVRPVAAEGELRRPWLFPTRRAYGYLIAARKP